jgi:hypothetical protein
MAMVHKVRAKVTNAALKWHFKLKHYEETIFLKVT